jgi:streptogramin lyase
MVSYRTKVSVRGRVGQVGRSRAARAGSRLGQVLLAAFVLVAVWLAPSALAAPTITEFTTGSGPIGATSGPDGNVWFVEWGANKIGRITPAGVLTEFSAGLSSNAGLAGIAAGPDGNLWFTEANVNKIGRITPTGVITQFSTGISGGSAPRGITAGPDGNLWFTETVGNRVGRITTTGSVTEFSSGISSGRNPWGITAGPDGNLWFTERVGTGRVARITTGGVVTEFGPTSGQPSGIAAGPDGNLWVALSANPGHIARVTPTGTITEFTTGLTQDGGPADIVAGGDGNLYFTESSGSGELGQITPAGVVTEFTTGLSSAPYAIARGGDGNIWFTEDAGNRVGRLTIAPAVVTSAPLATSSTDATLAGSVTPNSQATTYHFEWGATTAYGTTTTTASVGSGATPQPVSVAISGLTSLATYHYRVVASNGSGTTVGQDQLFTTLPAPVAPAPVSPGPLVTPPVGSLLPPATRPAFGVSAMVVAAAGTVRVKLPNASEYVSLTEASTVPLGSAIDTTRGTVALTSARDRSGVLQHATFWGGSFVVRQDRKAARTVLTLVGELTCAKAGRTTSATQPAPKALRLWGRDNRGRFETRGRSAVATVRGTAWVLRDTCEGTKVSVSRGKVSVRDLVRHRTVLVSAGHSYLARRR